MTTHSLFRFSTAPRRRSDGFDQAAATSIRAGGGNCRRCNRPPTEPYGLCVECQADDAMAREAEERLDAEAITADEQIRKGTPA